MFYGISNTMNWLTHFLIIGFILFYFGVQFGLIDNVAITDYNYQQTRNLIDVCEKEHNTLIEITQEITELKDLDIYRAYDECREDYRDLRGKIDAKWLATIIVFLLILFWGWFFHLQQLEKLKTKKGKK